MAWVILVVDRSNCAESAVTLRLTLKKSIASHVHASHPTQKKAHWSGVTSRSWERMDASRFSGRGGRRRGAKKDGHLAASSSVKY